MASHGVCKIPCCIVRNLYRSVPGGNHRERKRDKELLIYEQHLYLRQHGYGTSYVTGRYLLEQTLADYARQLETRGQDCRLEDFFDRLNAVDSIPIALGRWEMTGLDDMIR